MKFNGSEKQNKWAADIIRKAELTESQIDNLLKWAGPTMYDQGIMDVTIIIENRFRLAKYADELGQFYSLSSEEKHGIAESAADVMRRKV